MSKVNVGDLRGYAKEMGVNSPIELTIGDMKIKIKKHTSVLDKRQLAGDLFNACIGDEEDLHIVSNVMYDIFFVKLVVEEYTNLRLPKNDVEAYDLVVNTGIFDKVYRAMDEIERKELERIIADYFREQREKYDQDNSAGMVARVLMDTITSLIPSAEEIQTMFASLDTESEGFSGEELSNIAGIAQHLGDRNDDGTPKMKGSVNEEASGDDRDGEGK